MTPPASKVQLCPSHPGRELTSNPDVSYRKVIGIVIPRTVKSYKGMRTSRVPVYKDTGIFPYFPNDAEFGVGISPGNLYCANPRHTNNDKKQHTAILYLTLKTTKYITNLSLIL